MGLLQLVLVGDEATKLTGSSVPLTSAWHLGLDEDPAPSTWRGDDGNYLPTGTRAQYCPAPLLKERANNFMLDLRDRARLSLFDEV